MAQLLGADYHELTYNGSSLMRYATLCYKTIRLISRTKPCVVFYQNPSIILALTVTFCKAITFGRIVIVGDYHNAGVHPPFGKSLIKPLSRMANLILVSNNNLVETLAEWGCPAIAFPDPIPSIPAPVIPAKNERMKLLFICSWAEDEPINQVIAAGHQLDMLDIYITGKPKLDAYPLAREPSSNMHLTGFLPEHDFEKLIYECDIIMDLTTRDDCMVCGAYEGVAAEKPLILSDNQVTKDYFKYGALFTNNKAADIATKAQIIVSDYPNLKSQVSKLKDQLLATDQNNKRLLLEKLNIGDYK